MTTTRRGTAEEPAALRCFACDEPIADCELCDEPDCPRRSVTAASDGRWARRWRSRTCTAGEEACATRSRSSSEPMKDVAVVAYCRTGIARATRGALNQTHGIPMTAHVLRHAVKRAASIPPRSKTSSSVAASRRAQPAPRRFAIAATRCRVWPSA